MPVHAELTFERLTHEDTRIRTLCVAHDTARHSGGRSTDLAKLRTAGEFPRILEFNRA